MPRALLLVAALTGFLCQTGWSATREAPSYSAASIVNSASNQAGAIAPNTFLTIYGTNLAYTIKALSSADIHGNELPTILPGTGVNVYINHIRAHVYYVSPTQINVLVPSTAYAAGGELQLSLDGVTGPDIPLLISPTAPALFLSAGMAIAVHADGSLLTAAAPGRPGETIVLYATGLGVTVPSASYGEIPQRAAALRDIAQFRVILDGVTLDRSLVSYAGVSPGFAGLYQVNVQLPAALGPDPEVRLQTADAISPPGVHLAAAPAMPATQPAANTLQGCGLQCP